MARRDDLDAIAGTGLGHHAVRHVTARQRHGTHALRVGMHHEVCDHCRTRVGEDRATCDAMTVTHEVGEQHDLCCGQPVVAEERERVRHGHLHADAQVAERAPSLFREERMAHRRAHLAAGPSAHPEDGLDAVVDERLWCDDAQRSVGGQRSHRDRMPAQSQPVHLGCRAHRAGDRIEDRRVPRDALPRARAGTDDHERRRLQTGEQLVEIVVSGWQPGDRLATVVELLEPAEAHLEQIVDRSDRVGDAPLGDVVDHRLGPIDGLRHIVGDAVAELGDLACHADEPAQQRMLLDDVGVATGVGDRRRGRLEVDEHRRATDRVEQVRSP